MKTPAPSGRPTFDVYRAANDPQTANDPEPQMIPDVDLKSSSETQEQLVGAGKIRAGKIRAQESQERLLPAPTNCPWVSEDDLK